MSEFMMPLEARLLLAANGTAAHTPGDMLIAGGRGGTAVFLQRTATPARQVERDFDFDRGLRGWRGGFADYPAGSEDSFGLDWRLRKLPGEVRGADKKGFFITGDNHSDDLFMFLKRKLGRGDGIKPGQSYRVSYDIAFASNAPEGCAGIGGSPGNSVFMKAGADPVQPKAIIADGSRVMNIDKGNQGEGGEAASVAGDVSNGIPCDDALANPGGPPWRIVHRHHVHPTLRKANAKGQLWLMVGTDSGYEGTTQLYYTQIDVTLTPVTG